jgi:DNA-binding response OmpR family regulator
MGATVLVVEDDPLIAAFVVKALGKYGYEAEWVTTGQQALDRVRAGGVDLQLLDLGLPDIDGLEVLSRMRADGISLPVVVVTSRSDPKDRATAFGYGIDGYLMKPFGLTALIEVVRGSLSPAVRRT